MTRPAPIDGAGDAHCGCHRCEWYNNAGDSYWELSDGEIDGFSVEVHYCPSCGRALDEDADGRPVVGYEPEHIERALWLAAGNCDASIRLSQVEYVEWVLAEEEHPE